MGRPSNARDRLVEAAKDLIYARGYNAVGVKEICDAAGVNKGSFYHFFPTKRELLLAVIDAHVEWLGGVMELAAQPELTPLMRIRRLFVLVSEFDEEIRQRTGKMAGCPFGNLAAELNTQDEVVRAKLGAAFDAAAGFLEVQLREAVEVGEVSGIDPAASARAILAYLEGLQLLAATGNAPDVVRNLADGALRLAELGQLGGAAGGKTAGPSAGAV